MYIKIGTCHIEGKRNGGRVKRKKGEDKLASKIGRQGIMDS